MCQWGANRNLSASQEYAHPWPPRTTNRGVANRRPQIEHIMWSHRAPWSSLWWWPCCLVGFESVSDRVLILDHVRVTISPQLFNHFLKRLRFRKVCFDCFIFLVQSVRRNGGQLDLPSSTHCTNGYFRFIAAWKTNDKRWWCRVTVARKRRCIGMHKLCQSGVGASTVGVKIFSFFRS